MTATNPYVTLTPPQSPFHSLMQMGNMLPSFQPSMSTNYIPPDGNHPMAVAAAAAQQGVFGQHSTTMGGMLPYNTSQFPGSLPFSAMSIPPNIGMGYVYSTVPTAQYGLSSGVTQTTTSAAASSLSSSSSSSVPPPSAAANQPSPDGAMVGLGHPVHRTVSFPTQSQQVVLSHSSSTQNMPMHPTTHTRNLSDGQGNGRGYIPQRSQSNIEVQHVEAAMAAWNKKDTNPVITDPYQGLIEQPRYLDSQQVGRMVIQDTPVEPVEGTSQTVRRDPKHSGPRLADNQPSEYSSISVQSAVGEGESGGKVVVQQGGAVGMEGNVSQDGCLNIQRKDSFEARGQNAMAEVEPSSDHTHMIEVARTDVS